MILSLFMLTATIVLLYSQWKLIPSSVPAHIGFNGKTSGSMSKFVLIFLPVLQFLISILMFLPVTKKTMRFINIPYKHAILNLNEAQFAVIRPVIAEMLVSVTVWINFLFYYIVKFLIDALLKRPIKNPEFVIFMILILLIVLVFYSMYKIKIALNNLGEER